MRLRCIVLSIFLGMVTVGQLPAADLWICPQPDGTELFSDRNLTGTCRSAGKQLPSQKAPARPNTGTDPKPGLPPTPPSAGTLPTPSSAKPKSAVKPLVTTDGTIIQIARAGRRVPTGPGIFSGFEIPVEVGAPGNQPRSLTSDGRVIFVANMTATSSPSENLGIFIGSPDGITELVRLGQTAPDGNGMFATFDGTSIDNQGRGLVAFISTLAKSGRGARDDKGVFLAGDGPVRQIARADQTIPDGSGVYSKFTGLCLNSRGEVTFRAYIADISGTNNINTGIFLWKDGRLIQIARAEQTAPDGVQKFSGFSDPVINSKGQVAFVGYFAASTLDRALGGVFPENGAVYLWNGDGFDEIARVGQPAPDGDGVFSAFGAPALNERGQLAFQSYVRGAAGSTDTNGIYFATRTGIKQIAKSGQTAYDGNGTVLVHGHPRLDRNGYLAFPVTFTGTAGMSLDNSAIFSWSDSAGLVPIIHAGHRAMNGDGRLSGMSRPRVNDKEQITVSVSYVDTFNASGILLIDDTRTLEIARAGQPAPDGNGKFLAFSAPVLNDRGQLAFHATLTTGSKSDDAGIYIWTPLK